ncbi:hypothetical protein [Thiocystis violascens]|uniref:Uncharacterized protein n=1 Tax=Thiocystis violascens (strain ATCC 17096 / DSM 198 / 6111) TaxID=765911 RepID=I3Y8M9_THIV6|nr:hypothetical protein [Thiocystis violascens]AFL73347.1 hypothetical protein Thivi_1334 [Thiocystis violascens DSM 198]
MSSSSQQRHRHGVTKNLVEGIGGVLVGAALVLLMRGIVKRRAAEKPAADRKNP